MSVLEQFHYQIYGESNAGRDLVFLHGLMGAGANWRRIVSQLEGNYRVLVFDQRGHGRSFKPDSGYDPEDFAEDLRQILDELGWQRLGLLGHSMGGRNALAFASKYPERLGALVLEDISPESRPQGLTRIRHLLDLVPTPFASRKEARQFFKNKFPGLLKGDPQAGVLAQYFYTNIEERPDATADWRFKKDGILFAAEGGRRRDRWKEWEALALPLMVIRGENTHELSKVDFEKMAKLQPSAEMVEVAGAGHWVHFDKPAPFIEKIEGFFAKHIGKHGDL